VAGLSLELIFRWISESTFLGMARVAEAAPERPLKRPEEKQFLLKPAVNGPA
jgi:hypothetical protein